MFSRRVAKVLPAVTTALSLWQNDSLEGQSLVGKDGGLEIKCPKTSTHLKWLMAGVVPEEHQGQMYWNMLCCDRDWWDFVSYDPRLPKGLQVFTARLHMSAVFVSAIEGAVIAFNDEIEAALAPLRALVIPEPQPVEDTRSAYEQVCQMADELMIGELIP
jgi:hypothetical protein